VNNCASVARQIARGKILLEKLKNILSQKNIF
jgi:hypothetical protein